MTLTQHCFKNHLGEDAVLYQHDSGNWSCPVCGGEFTGSLDEDPVYFLSSLEVCGWCMTQLGNDDIPSKEEIAKTPIMGRWANLRIKWLDKENWNEAAIKQVCDNLDMTLDQLREDQAKFSK